MEIEELEELVKNMAEIGTALSSERELDVLLEMIVEEGRRFANADGGTLFLVNEERGTLDWAIIQNETMGIRIGGRGESELDESVFQPLPLRDDHGSHELAKVAAYVANRGEPVNIGDVYSEGDEFDFTGPLRFDEQTGYRTRSMLVVPLRHFDGVIGVLQLINARSPKTGELVSFSEQFETLTTSLASQAAVAVKNAQLFDELERQFEGFIRTIAMAIDEKSKYTAGHVRRVVEITMAIADRMNASDEEFGEVEFSHEELKALRVASWMHDVGKIATPEYVVDKPTKLSTIFDRVELVRARYQMLEQKARVDALESMLTCENPERWPEIESTYRTELEELRDELALIERSNEGGEFMRQELVDRIRAIGEKTYELDGEEHPRLTPNEVENLCIRKGTLTIDERDVIREHAAISLRMLSQLPFSRHLESVPEIAAGHHEKLNGKGYPRGLTADQLSIQARILAVADIFEALTAADRPYKRPTPLSGVKRILNAMVQDGELDERIIDFAVRSGVFDEYAEREVSEEQRDIVLREAWSE